MRLMKIVVGLMALIAVRAHGQCGWEAIGAGIGQSNNASGFVLDLLALPSGDFVVGGVFNNANGLTTNGVARCDGQQWFSLGAGLRQTSGDATQVIKMILLPNGDLVVGGSFSHAGAVSARNIARWNGSEWSSLGHGLGGDGSSVRALAVLPNGDLIAAGYFSVSGGVAVNNIARWDGESWQAIGAGLPYTYCLEVLPDGSVVAGCDAGFGFGYQVRRWNGLNWSPLGGDFQSSLYDFALLTDGTLVVGGAFLSVGGVPANYVAKWNGTSWSAIGEGCPWWVSELEVLPNGDILAGSYFSPSGLPANRIYRWNGIAWGPLPNSLINDAVFALEVLPAGDLVAGGVFSTVNGSSMSGIAISRKLSVSIAPSSTEICVHTALALYADAKGASPQYQWRKNSVNILGAQSAMYTIPSVQRSDAGAYDCVVSNACGSVTSAAASVTVLTPQILNPPFDQSVNVDQPVNFVVETDESSPCHSNLQFQWQRRDPLVADDNEPNAWITLQNGGGIFGATSPNLLILRPTPGLATGYRCRITGGCGCEFANSSVYYTSTVNYSAACPSDFNLDGSVDGDDVIAFFERWDGGC